MRKTMFLTVLFCCLAFISSVVFSNDSLADFKNAKWGMSQTDVILSEKDLPTGEEGNILYYRPDFFTDPFLLELQDEKLSVFEDARYYFSRGLLVGGERIFQPVIMNDSKFDYDSLFNYLSNLLNNQHGEGESEEVWASQPRTGGLNQLVYSGELTRKVTWFTQMTQITLVQQRSDYYGTIIIKTTLNYKKLEKILTVDEAVDIIFVLPEVRAFSERMKIADQSWRVSYHGVKSFLDDSLEKNDWYFFQVYEDHPTHTATFGWYYVSAKTGEVVDIYGEPVAQK